MPYFVSDQSYGKCALHLTKVSRTGARHSVDELTVDIELDGDFSAAYTAADNRLVVPTDTMKNTVYALAKQHDITPIESFGQRIGQHFIGAFDHVTRATARLTKQPWQRILVDGSEHDHAFIGTSVERETAIVSNDRQSLQITSGLDSLSVLKTTRSGFCGFLRDRYTTLEETADRILATTMTASWDSDRPDTDWTSCRRAVRRALVETFAEHDSASVQHTLYAMASAALDRCQNIQAITLEMPNQHRILVDLKPFELENVDEIFVATREPHGMISATVRRDSDP